MTVSTLQLCPPYLPTPSSCAPDVVALVEGLDPAARRGRRWWWQRDTEGPRRQLLTQSKRGILLPKTYRRKEGGRLERSGRRPIHSSGFSNLFHLIFRRGWNRNLLLFRKNEKNKKKI